MLSKIVLQDRGYCCVCHVALSSCLKQIRLGWPPLLRTLVRVASGQVPYHIQSTSSPTPRSPKIIVMSFRKASGHEQGVDRLLTFAETAS